MWNLNKSDFLMALIFGCFISLLYFQIQSSRKGHKNIPKKEVPHRLHSSRQNPQSLRNNLVINSKHAKKAPVFQNNSLTYLEENSERKNPESEFIDKKAKTQVNREMPMIDRKLESYLFHQIGLSEKEISRVLYAKKLMEDEIFKNTQSFVNPTDEDSTKLNTLNQQTLFYYNEELKQILGSENYQKYYKWQGEQDVAFSENYAN